MWIDVKYKEELKLHQKIRVKRTGHEATISKIEDTDKFGWPLHCLCYVIQPEDPNDLGGGWYFSHSLEKLEN